jgi:Conserved TM helix
MAVVGQVDIEGGLERAWESIITFLPKLGGFLLILVLGYILAKVLERILGRVLERVGFDRLVERGGVKQALDRSKYDASNLLAKLVFYTIFLFVLQLAFGVFGPNPISDLIESIIAFLPNLFVAVLIIVITAAVATGVGNVVGATLSGLTYGRTLATLASAAIWVVGITAALTQINVAEPIVTGIFYALLALVVGVGIVAIGGGGIEPMRERWQRALNRMDEEAPRVREESQGMGEEARRRADEARREVTTEPTPEQASQPAQPYPPEAPPGR